MSISTSKKFLVYFFADDGFYKIWAREINVCVAFNHQCFIAHDREVGPACNTWAHHCSNLRDAHCTHAGIIPEDATEMFFIRKDLVLHWKKNSGTVDEINDGQTIFHRYFLHPQILLTGN